MVLLKVSADDTREFVVFAEVTKVTKPDDGSVVLLLLGVGSLAKCQRLFDQVEVIVMPWPNVANVRIVLKSDYDSIVREHGVSKADIAELKRESQLHALAAMEHERMCRA